MKTLEKGSLVDYKSLRSEDLLPAFLKLLRSVDESTANEFILDNFEYLLQEDFWETQAEHSIYYLIDILNNYCPAGYYFGASEGNTSDFGVWENYEE